MKLIKIASIGIILLNFASCGNLLKHRNFINESEDEMWVPGRDFRVVSGDNGRMGRSLDEVRGRIPASIRDSERGGIQLKNEKSLEYDLMIKEKSLSQEEYQIYVEDSSYLNTSYERLYYLDLTPSERRIYLLSKNGHIQKSRKYRDNYSPYERSDSGPQTNLGQIFTGMDKEQVVAVWGRPVRIDVAGDPREQNERWSFYEGGSRKQVYFEAGLVHGWVLE